MERGNEFREIAFQDLKLAPHECFTDTELRIEKDSAMCARTADCHSCEKRRLPRPNLMQIVVPVDQVDAMRGQRGMEQFGE